MRKLSIGPGLAEGVTSAILFASVPVVIHATAANVWTLGLVRLGAAMLYGLLFQSQTRLLAHCALREWVILALIGTAFSLHWATYAWCMKLAGASAGSLAMATYGVFLVFLGCLKSRTRPRTVDMVVLSVALVGVGLSIPNFTLKDGTTLGLLLGIVSAFSYALLPLLHQECAHLHTNLRSFGQYLFALPLFLLALPWTNWDASPSTWLQLAYLAFVGTIVAHNLWVKASTILPHFLTALLYYFHVAMAVALGIVVLGEQLTFRTGVGAVLILGSSLWGAMRYQRTKGSAQVTDLS